MKEIEKILKEVLNQVNEFREDYTSNEQAVRTQLIEPILSVLGWKTSNPNFVRPNAPADDGKIPDYTLVKNKKTKLIVEAKNLSKDLKDNKIIDQLASYCFKSGIDFGVLTNGAKWLLFKTFERNPKDRIVWEIDIEKEKLDYVASNLQSFAYANIDTLDILLKESKILESNWKELVKVENDIVAILSEKLLKKIKIVEKSFQIDPIALNTFVRNKIKELFKLNEIDEVNKGLNEITEDNRHKKTNIDNHEGVVFKRHKKSKIRKKICVTFPDNIVIKGNKVVNTFMGTIKKIGPERIIPLNLHRSGVPIISKTKHDFYNQHRLGRFWIMVHTSTRDKIQILEEINKKLKLDLKIEIYTNEGKNADH
jgi:predicted type IV restriction endonuclease